MRYQGIQFTILPILVSTQTYYPLLQLCIHFLSCLFHFPSSLIIVFTKELITMSSEWFSPNDDTLCWATPPAGVSSKPSSLPKPSEPIPSSSVFKFTEFDPNLLNCTVIGDASFRSVAVVEWKERPGAIVEIRDDVMRTTVAQWLQLAPDRRYLDFG